LLLQEMLAAVIVTPHNVSMYKKPFQETLDVQVEVNCADLKDGR